MSKRTNTAGLVQIQNYEKKDWTSWIEADESEWSDNTKEYKLDNLQALQLAFSNM